MKTIEVQISSEPVTGFARIARHENFVLLPDLNMIQEVRIQTIDPKTGTPILDLIAQDETLTADQKNALALKYQDQRVSRTTAGAFVDKSGAVVNATDEGAIPQLAHFQAITLGDMRAAGIPITDKTPFSVLLYAMLKNEIGTIDQRKGL